MRKKQILNFFFTKKFIKNSNNIPSITSPWHGARACKISRKYSNVFSNYSTKTKCDGHTDGQRHCFNTSYPGPSAWWEIKINKCCLWIQNLTQNICCKIFHLNLIDTICNFKREKISTNANNMTYMCKIKILCNPNAPSSLTQPHSVLVN